MVSTSRFQKIIRDYYRLQGRDLPWRRTRDPYRILVSEIMLQQTQVARVEGFYGHFLKKFPDFRALAAAKAVDVLRAWQGLGYNRRALALHRLAKEIVRKNGGALPRSRAALEALPAIGPYTAGAVLAFAFDQPELFIETNIRRVFIHFFFPKRRKVRDDEIKVLLKKTFPGFRHARSRPAHPDGNKNPLSMSHYPLARFWYYALMDYGAMLGATEKKNPNRRSAHYAKQSKFAGSDRELRGKILRLLLERKHVWKRELGNIIPESEKRLERITDALVEEGFVLKMGNFLSLQV